MSAKPALSVGMIGCNFMGKAHSNAWRQAPRFFDLPAEVRLHTICARSADSVEKARVQFGWDHAVTDWRDIVSDPSIDIVDICTPNDSHAEIAIAAAQHGKAILCEKPLALNVTQAREMAAAVKKARVVNMVCHNYRRIPAIALARRMIEEGAIGDRIYHYRARYAQDWIADPAFPMVWRLDSKISGSGAHGDINAHVIDLGRYLVGEFAEVCGLMETFVHRRPTPTGKMARVTVDDAVSWIGRFKNGALANVEATRFAHGRKNHITLEINGSKGSLAFDFEEMNRLQYYNVDDPPTAAASAASSSPSRFIPTPAHGGRPAISSATSTRSSIRSPISSAPLSQRRACSPHSMTACKTKKSSPPSPKAPKNGSG